MIQTVSLKHVEKELRKLQPHLLRKFRRWVKDIEEDGWEVVHRVPGWKDHPLAGKRKGQRAISLNGPWRAIYVITKDTIEFLDVLEVTPHDY